MDDAKMIFAGVAWLALFGAGWLLKKAAPRAAVVLGWLLLAAMFAAWVWVWLQPMGDGWGMLLMKMFESIVLMAACIPLAVFLIATPWGPDGPVKLPAKFMSQSMDDLARRQAAEPAAPAAIEASDPVAASPSPAARPFWLSGFTWGEKARRDHPRIAPVAGVLLLPAWVGAAALCWGLFGPAWGLALGLSVLVWGGCASWGMLRAPRSVD